ncbi:MAG: ester cyclase [Actinomycetota bacterium]
MLVDGIDSAWRAGKGRESIMSEGNKALVRRSWELPDNLDILDEVYPPDLVWHDPDRDIKGSEEAKQFISMYKTAFPDLSTTVEDVIAENDKVVTRWTVRGTHQGEIEEFGPPTGRQVEIKGITIHHVEGSKIVEEWNTYDNLSVMQQLGLMSEQ